MFQGQTGKIDPLNPGKSGIFPVFSYFSACPCLKSGLPNCIKIIFLGTARTRLSFHTVGVSCLITVISGSI